MIVRGFTTNGTGEKLTPFPCGPGGSGTDTDDQQAVEVPYDDSGSGLGASDVQGAIDALAAQVAACCDSMMGGGQFSSGDLLSTGEVEEISGAGKQDQIYPDFVRPVNGDFAWINQGGASVTVNANGGIHLIAPANAGISVRVRKKAAPGTPYSITSFFLFNLVNFDFQSAGHVWRQSSDGKLILFLLLNRATGDIAFSCQDFNSPTSFSATNSGLGVDHLGDKVWFRIGEDASNRYCDWSVDGYNFTRFFSEGRTTFLTADEVGWFASDSSNSKQASITMESWEQGA